MLVYTFSKFGEVLKYDVRMIPVVYGWLNLILVVNSFTMLYGCHIKYYTNKKKNIFILKINEPASGNNCLNFLKRPKIHEKNDAS